MVSPVTVMVYTKWCASNPWYRQSSSCHTELALKEGA